MLWDENDAISNLNVEIPTSAGWVLLEVQDINDSGQIVDDVLIRGQGVSTDAGGGTGAIAVAAFRHRVMRLSVAAEKGKSLKLNSEFRGLFTNANQSDMKRDLIKC